MPIVGIPNTTPRWEANPRPIINSQQHDLFNSGKDLVDAKHRFHQQTLLVENNPVLYDRIIGVNVLPLETQGRKGCIPASSR